MIGCVRLRGVFEAVRAAVGGGTEFTARQWALLAAPFALVASMYVTFQGLVARLGYGPGFGLSMIVYWVGWCTLLPLAVLGPAGYVDLFREAKPRLGERPWLTLLALLWPLPFAFVFAFLPRIREATTSVLLASVAVGVAVAVAEEVLWRGTYVRVFPDSTALGHLFPGVLFGLWHLVPNSVHETPYPGAPYSFVLYALALGLSYGYYAFETGSIRWATVSHAVHDSLGVAGGTFLALVDILA
jgi:membrane protease YdiL (CAAX protease family)